jgi:translation initiation factor 1 (eIF-1/SUI1)
MKYPAVVATVEDSTVIIQGEARNTEVEKLITALKKLNVKSINNWVRVK